MCLDSSAHKQCCYFPSSFLLKREIVETCGASVKERAIGDMVAALTQKRLFYSLLLVVLMAIRDDSPALKRGASQVSLMAPSEPKDVYCSVVVSV